jgi:nucleoside-diphosphate-sugar epimerase
MGVSVAITGGTGFVGSRLVARHLEAGDRVRVLTRRGSDAVAPGAVAFRGDLADPQQPLEPFVEGADVVYHCAGELRTASLMHALHVDGTGRLARAASGRVGRWVQLGSAGVYGPHAGPVVTEESPLRPANEYERSKAESDRMLAKVGADGGLPWTILRPTIVFGPGMPNASLRALVRHVRRGSFCFVGARGAIAPYVPVDNVAAALMLCARHPDAPGQVYNLSDDRTMEEFIGVIAGALGCPTPRLRLPRGLLMAAAAVLERLPGAPLTRSRVRALSGRTRYPTQKIEVELGYRRSVGLEDALRALAIDCAT